MELTLSNRAWLRWATHRPAACGRVRPGVASLRRKSCQLSFETISTEYIVSVQFEKAFAEPSITSPVITSRQQPSGPHKCHSRVLPSGHCQVSLKQGGCTHAGTICCIIDLLDIAIVPANSQDRKTATGMDYRSVCVMQASATY